MLLGYALLEGSRDEFVCFAQDLTQQKRAEAALADQVTKAVTDSAAAALFMLDEHGVCAFANPAAEAMIGWSLAELSGRTLHEAIHHHAPDGQPLPVEACAMHQLLAAGGSRLEPCEEVFFRKSGEPFPVVCTAQRIERPGQPPAMLLEMRDVTEHKRFLAEREALLESERAARTEAERANRAKDEFVATLSHELRTPLNAIVGWAELARRPGQSPDKVDKALAVVERNARALADIIADLLDVSRISSGKLRIEVAPVDLGGVVTAALDALRAAADAKRITLSTSLEVPDAMVAGDAVRLQQVAWNLVSNAIKFTPPGGRVEVSIEARSGGLRLSVRDTGPGIDAAFQPRLFERFRQADPSISRGHSGLGLGLALVKHLVDVHGGTVRAESEGTGRGALFTVELPRATPSVSAAPPPASCEGPGSQGARILVVEDEADAREMVKRLIGREQGAEVVVAASATEALAAAGGKTLRRDGERHRHAGDRWLRADPPRARGIGGADLQARPPSRSPRTPSRPEDRERALSAGFQAHLTKPVDPDEMLAVVGALLGARPARLETPRDPAPVAW